MNIHVFIHAHNTHTQTCHYSSQNRISGLSPRGYLDFSVYSRAKTLLPTQHAKVMLNENRNI